MHVHHEVTQLYINCKKLQEFDAKKFDYRNINQQMQDLICKNMHRNAIMEISLPKIIVKKINFV